MSLIAIFAYIVGVFVCSLLLNIMFYDDNPPPMWQFIVYVICITWPISIPILVVGTILNMIVALGWVCIAVTRGRKF